MKLYIVKKFYKKTSKVFVKNKNDKTLYEGGIFNIPIVLLNCDVLDIEPMIDENNKSLFKIIIKED